MRSPAALAYRGASCCFRRSRSALPASATTTTAAAGATTAAAATATLPFLRLVDAQRTASHVLTVQRLDGALCVRSRHFHEAEAARTTRLAIVDQRHRLNRAVLREQLAHLSLVCRERQVTHIDPRHRSSNSLAEKAPSADS